MAHCHSRPRTEYRDHAAQSQMLDGNEFCLLGRPDQFCREPRRHRLSRIDRLLAAAMNDLSEKIIAHYQRHASAWDTDRRRSGWNDRPWHDRFVRLLRKGASVLDL